MFLPEVLLSTKVMHKGLDIINPLLAKLGQKGMGKVVIGTVEGDIHDIGKRIVGFLLEGNGFEVIDLGVDVKADAFIKVIEETKPDILGMSALLTTTMPYMGEVINLLKERKPHTYSVSPLRAVARPYHPSCSPPVKSISLHCFGFLSRVTSVIYDV